jgi:hypothetical protein
VDEAGQARPRPARGDGLAARPRHRPLRPVLRADGSKLVLASDVWGGSSGRSRTRSGAGSTSPPPAIRTVDAPLRRRRRGGPHKGLEPAAGRGQQPADRGGHINPATRTRSPSASTARWTSWCCSTGRCRRRRSPPWPATRHRPSSSSSCCQGERALLRRVPSTGT